ncbi:hypothetical protein [Haloarchaeobius sp. DFWS5]|uniref:hypothetical protein n=1 Tax=Haloarchaeobius sp. DFWS5 TaxID=3446114 RepID=UPI003EBC3D0D
MYSTEALSNTTTVSKEGVHVEKGIEPGDNRMTVHYRLTSDHDTAVAVRIVEALGAGFPTEALDLDAAGRSDWLLEGPTSQAVLMAILDPEKSVTTRYVVNSDEPKAVEQIFAAPTIDVVDPVESSGRSSTDTTHEDAVEVRRDASEVGRTAGGRRHSGERAAESTGHEEHKTHRATVSAPASLDGETVVDALVAALAAGAVDDEQVATLRKHVAPPVSRSDSLRFRRLQSRLEDFATYADGLADLIDEHGTASGIVDDLHDDIAAVRASLDETAARLDEASGEQPSAAARFRAAEEQLTTVANRLDTVDDRLTTVDTHLDRIEARFDRLDGRVESLDGRVEGLSVELDAARSETASLSERVDDSMADLDDRLTSLESSVESTEAWREQLGEAFQGRVFGGDDEFSAEHAEE